MSTARFPLATGATAVLLSLTLTGAAAATVAVTLFASSAAAAAATVNLGTAAPFAVLAGSAVTNTGPSVLRGDLGLSPGTAVTGFPPGTVLGTQHVADAVALQAENDLVTAYNSAAGQTPRIDKTGQDLGGQTLVGGVYNATAAMSLTGTLVLDAQGKSDTVFVFQAGSTLITSSGSSVQLTGGAQPCNVYWQVGSSATLGTASRFVGTVMALTSATLQTGATLEGRVLARNGAVTLDTNVINRPACAAAPPTPAPPTPA
ncbi:MAG: ice-binding family protein, partial [Nocardioides sp.]